MKATKEMVKAGAAAARKYMEETGGNSPSVIWDAMWAAQPNSESSVPLWVEVAFRTEVARSMWDQFRKEISTVIAPFDKLDADTVQRLVDAVPAPLVNRDMSGFSQWLKRKADEHPLTSGDEFIRKLREEFMTEYGIPFVSQDEKKTKGTKSSNLSPN
jgi:hypothetical protein